MYPSDNELDWPDDGLECLGHCPVCGSSERSQLYTRLADRLFGAPGYWTMYLCLACGTEYLDPRPSQETIALAYSQYETHRPANNASTRPPGLATRLRNGYLNRKFGYQMKPASRWGYFAMHCLPPPWHLEWEQFARHLHAPKPGQTKLLDVGCGNGEFLVRARQQGWQVHGLDSDEAALEYARQAGIKVTQGSVKTGLFLPASFDCITTNQVLEHVHDPRAFLTTLHDWLKPGGVLWVGTPNMNASLHKEFGNNWHLLHPPQHLSILSPKALRDMLRAVGFTHLQARPRGYMETHIHRISSKLTRLPIVPAYGGKTELLSPTGRACSSLRSVWMEMRTWLKPATGSDMIFTAEK